MALTILALERTFLFKNGASEIALADPNPQMSPDEVMNFYSGTYPELTTATVQGPEINEDKALYRFKLTIGTKG